MGPGGAAGAAWGSAPLGLPYPGATMSPPERDAKRVAALYDIHGNLPALEAVLEEVHGAGVDRIVVGGDVVPGPMPRETLERLLSLERPVDFIHGNCELAVLAQLSASDPDSVTYWGTISGRPLPEPYRGSMIWASKQMTSFRERLASWPRSHRVSIEALGDVLFCHSTPRSETEVFTRLTAEARLAPVFQSLGASIVVCGHTHMQFDRMIGNTRVVNAGSVGMPFGAPGAFWALIGPDVQLKCTHYDLAGTAARIRRIRYPGAESDARTLLEPPTEAEMLEIYGNVELGQ